MSTKTNEMLRWGNGMRADPNFARERILDAALDCFQRNSFQEIGMAEIAREAKVTRATIYRHFENRNDVILSVIFRELNGMLDTIQQHISEETSFAEFIVETMVVADEKVRLSPIFELIVNESAMLLERLQEYGSELLSVSAVSFQARFEEAKAAGELQPDLEYDEFVRWLYHVGASFILIPRKTQTSQAMKLMLWRYLIPAIVRDEALPKKLSS